MIIHRVLLFAAGLILARWHAAGQRSVRLHGGMLYPSPIAAGPGSWPVTSGEAATVLVGTVLAGKRYQGWDAACQAAEYEPQEEAA